MGVWRLSNPGSWLQSSWLRAVQLAAATPTGRAPFGSSDRDARENSGQRDGPATGEGAEAGGVEEEKGRVLLKLAPCHIPPLVHATVRHSGDGSNPELVVLVGVTEESPVGKKGDGPGRSRLVDPHPLGEGQRRRHLACCRQFIGRHRLTELLDLVHHKIVKADAVGGV